MSDYKAKNSSQSTKFLFSERSKFYAAPELQGSTTLTDYRFFENIYYHRIDSNYNTIIPNENYITDHVFSANQTIPFRGFSFASKALIDFIEDYNQQIESQPGTDKDNPYFSQLRVHQSFVSPVSSYENYLNFYLQEYLRFIKTKKQNLIHNFENFVNHFFIFFENTSPHRPMTFSSWQKSKFSNLFTTGMAFSVSSLDCGDDSVKEKYFIDSKNWETYVTLAGNYGFNIIKTCPWILVANCNSSVMQSYVEADKEILSVQKNFTNTEGETGTLTNFQFSTFENNNQMYSNIYNKTYLNDIYYININILKYYNKLINDMPYYYKLIYTNQGTRKINYNRPPYEELDDLFWLNFYIDTRNKEENSAFSDAILNRIKENVKYLIKKFDFSNALGYINDQYKAAHLKQPGGLNEFLFLENNTED